MATFPVGPTVGQTVTINNVVWTWTGYSWSSDGPFYTYNIKDVDTLSIPPVNNQVLAYDSTNREWVPRTMVGVGTISVDQLTDVDTSTTPPTIGQVLQWNGTNWVPITPSTSAFPTYNRIVSSGALNLTMPVGVNALFYSVENPGNITISLPFSAAVGQSLYFLRNSDWSTNLVSFSGNITIGIENGSPVTLDNNVSAVHFVFDGTNWMRRLLFGSTSAVGGGAQVLTGTLAARPAVTTDGTIYVVQGEITFSLNGTASIYDVQTNTWFPITREDWKGRNAIGITSSQSIGLDGTMLDMTYFVTPSSNVTITLPSGISNGTVLRFLRTGDWGAFTVSFSGSINTGVNNGSITINNNVSEVVFVWNGAQWMQRIFYGSSLGGASGNLDSLTDVNTTTIPLTLNDVLMYNGTEWRNYQMGIDQLVDVNTTGVTNGQYLQYSAGQWVPASISSSGFPLYSIISAGGALNLTIPVGTNAVFYSVSNPSPLTVTIPDGTVIGQSLMFVRNADWGTNSVTFTGTISSIIESGTPNINNDVSSILFVWNGTLWNRRLFFGSTAGGSANFQIGPLSSRPGSATDGFIYQVFGDPSPFNNNKTFVYDTNTTAWYEVGFARGGITVGVLGGRPASANDGEMYYVSGDPTPSNDGRCFVYDTSTLTWRELGQFGAAAAGVSAKTYINAGGTFNISIPANSFLVEYFLNPTSAINMVLPTPTSVGTTINVYRAGDWLNFAVSFSGAPWVVGIDNGTPTINNDISCITFIWNGAAWVRRLFYGSTASGGGGGVLVGTLAARPATAADGTIYVVNGDPTVVNNGVWQIYDTATTAWYPMLPVTSNSINSLSDVDTVAFPPSTGQSLQWNGSQWIPANVGVGVPSYNIINLATGTYTATIPVGQFGLLFSVENTGSITIALPGAATVGQNLLFVRNSDWLTNSVTFSGTINVGTQNGSAVINNDVSSVLFIWNGTAWMRRLFYGSTSSAGATNLDQLTDVNTSTLPLAANDVLMYTGAEWRNYQMNLDQLSDVSTVGAANGQVLQYNGAQWSPVSMATGGVPAYIRLNTAGTYTVNMPNGTDGLFFSVENTGALTINLPGITGIGRSLYFVRNSNWNLNTVTFSGTISVVIENGTPTLNNDVSGVLFIWDGTQWDRRLFYGSTSSSPTSIPAKTYINTSGTFNLTVPINTFLVEYFLSPTGPMNLVLPTPTTVGTTINIYRAGNWSAAGGFGIAFSGAPWVTVIDNGTPNTENDVSCITFIWNGTAWVRRLLYGSTSSGGSQVLTGTLASRPVPGVSTEGTVYVVEGDTPINNGQTFIFDSQTSAWKQLTYPIFNGDLYTFMSTGVNQTLPTNVSANFGLFYMINPTAPITVTLQNGVTVGQTVRILRSGDWNTNTVTFGGTINIGFENGTPVINNNLSEIVFTWNGSAWQRRLIYGSTSGGDVTGPANAIPTSIARYDNVTGKALRNSQVLVDDFGSITQIRDHDMSGRSTQNTFTTPTYTLDCAQSNFQIFTPTANGTFSFTNVPANRAYILTLRLVLGAFTVSFPPSVSWNGGTPPTFSQNKTHLLFFYTDDGGVKWRASALVDYTT